MADPRAELRRVSEELVLIEQQLESLLERQTDLLEKKAQLESAIKDAAKAPDSDQNRDWEKSDFEWSRKLAENRSKIFNVQAFRPLQLSTMNATLAGRDCILIMPTGGGKSLCFQLPAVISKGVTLVVSPLVSLMEDQLMSLKKLGVNAEMLSAAASREQVNAVHASMTTKNSQLKLLYVTPEKLAKSKRFMNKLEKMYEAGNFSRLVIDEVHCCSQWGHDFRPDYKFLGVMKRQFPGVPILGLTATATNAVVADVKKILQITDCVMFKASFNRTNLFYEVHPKISNFKAGIDEIKKLIDSRFSGQSGIVYCFSRKDTEEVARELQVRNIKAGCYHADMEAKHRSQVHHAWMANTIQVVVATIAFGMGIDKPNVRFVIHHSMSKSMENYYQESGRAGRDDEKAYCILFAGFSDIYRQSTMVFTEQTGLDKLYAMVAYAQDVGTCRRTLIARHFGERWDPNKCNRMCDHCENAHAGSFGKKDISSYCRDVLRILENARVTKQRITALKLLDSWMGKGATLLRVKSVTPPKLSSTHCERLIAHMLVQGYIREDFHFTPYSTISYLLPGSRSALLNSDEYQVKLEFFEKGPKSSTKPASTKSSSAAAAATAKRATPSLSVINTEKSAFCKNPVKIKSDEKQRVKKDVKKLTKKRKPLIIDSDSDLDFCEASVTPVKRVKKGKSVEKYSNSNANKCIVLDDSEDEGVEKDKTTGRNSSDPEELRKVYMDQLAKAEKCTPHKDTKRQSKDTLSESFNKTSEFSQLSISDGEVLHDSDDELDSLRSTYQQQLDTL